MQAIKNLLYLSIKYYFTIKKNLYISLLFVFGLLSVHAQVTIEGELHIEGNTTFVVSGQDIYIEEAPTGEGKIVQKSNGSQEVRVVFQGKELSADEMKIASIEQYTDEVESPKTYYAENDKYNIESIVVEPRKDIVVPKMGSIVLTRVSDDFYTESLPNEGIYTSQHTAISMLEVDNYFSLNYNYTLITKEPIVSSQNMHDTLLVKSNLDPPKYEI